MAAKGLLDYVGEAVGRVFDHRPTATDQKAYIIHHPPKPIPKPMDGIGDWIGGAVTGEAVRRLLQPSSSPPPADPDDNSYR